MRRRFESSLARKGRRKAQNVVAGDTKTLPAFYFIIYHNTFFRPPSSLSAAAAWSGSSTEERSAECGSVERLEVRILSAPHGVGVLASNSSAGRLKGAPQNGKTMYPCSTNILKEAWLVQKPRKEATM